MFCVFEHQFIYGVAILKYSFCFNESSWNAIAHIESSLFHSIISFSSRYLLSQHIGTVSSLTPCLPDTYCFCPFKTTTASLSCSCLVFSRDLLFLTQKCTNSHPGSYLFSSRQLLILTHTFTNSHPDSDLFSSRHLLILTQTSTNSHPDLY